MSDGPANGPQPRQVILWRSRSNGTVRVSDNYVADGTPSPLQTDQIEVSDLPEIATGRDLVVGRPLPLEIRLPREEAPPVLETCPYCFQILPQDDAEGSGRRSRDNSQSWDSGSTTAASVAAPRSHVLGDLDESRILAVDPLRKKKRTQMLLTRPYFRMLERVAIGDAPSGTSSGPSSSRGTRESSRRSSIDRVIDGDADAATDEGQAFAGMEGYYKRFFVEEKRLGMGAQGTVYLCRHVVNGNLLSYHAIKKIAVGNSKEYLADMLREVRLLEGLRHKNIIPYETVWVEPASFSRLAPPIEALHILMMYANLGNIDTYITARHSMPEDGQTFDMSGQADSEAEPLSKDEMKKLFRRRRLSSRAGEGLAARRQDVRGILLFSREEIESLFGDILEGLEFLHAKGIVHLDLKCQNVLLHLFDGDLIPTCMISDFGSSRAVYQYSDHRRTGETGTMEYLAPETITPNKEGKFLEMDSRLDIWGLGMILHKILFFSLPYGETSTYDELSDKIKRYPGYKASPETRRAFQRRGIPVEMLDVLETLLHVDPARRPKVSRLLKTWRSIQLQHNTSPPVAVELVKSAGDFASTHRHEPPVLNPPGNRTLALPPPFRENRLLTLSVWEGCLKYVIAATKIVTVVPPLRARPLSPARFYLVVLLALFDLAQSDVKTSVVLGTAHLVLIMLR